jgi:Holliday junction resolvasome RuvABC endonuclease subunit
MSLFLGIDPGKSGSLAFVTDSGSAWTVKGDCTHRDLVDAIRDAQGVQPIAFAYIEFVASSPQMGVKSAFSFGQSYGALEMLLAACNVPFERITPRKWQTAMKCLTGGDKNISKQRCQELFPSMKITHANADALLIAECARRQSYPQNVKGHASPEHAHKIDHTPSTASYVPPC